jgi:hypothetical protein
MVPNSTGDAVQNAAVLNGIIALAQATNDQSSGKYYGAIIVIPGHDALATVGGTGIDDGGIYFLQGPGDGTPTIPIASNWPIKFLGTGSAKLVNHVPTGEPDFVMGDMFAIRTNGRYDSNPHDMLGDNLGGMTFENLTLEFDKNTMVTSPAQAAIHTVTDFTYTEVGGAQNVRINGCVFSDCPIGVWFEQALQCSMFQCTATYVHIVGTAVKLGGANEDDGEITGIFAKDIFLTDCVFEVPSMSSTKGNSIGLDIVSAEHVRLKSVRFDGFYQGIYIRPGYGTSPASGTNAVRCFFTDVNVFAGRNSTTGTQAGTALTIEPQSSNQQIAQLTFVGCTFEPGGDSAITSTSGAGIVIEANGSIIDTIRFVSCYSCRWTGPGLSIGISGDSGTLQNIEVSGGMYAGNNLSAGSSAYGIAMFGTPSAVRVVGVSCVGEYEFIQHNSDGASPTQNVGIYVDSGVSNVLISAFDCRNNGDKGIVVNGGASDIIIDACNVTGNTNYGVYVNAATSAVAGVFIRNCNASGYTGGYTSAINVTTSGTNASTVQITNSAGYNDQSVTLTHSYPSGGLADFHGYSLSYYGPLEFYIVGGSVTISSIKVGSVTTGLLQGSFFLMPGEDAVIAWTPPTGTLTIPAIGK